jgi:hypothetical protein
MTPHFRRGLFAHTTHTMRLTFMFALCGCGLAAAPGIAHAQGRLEIAGSVGFAANHDLGSERATESGNGVPTGTPVTLFETDSSLDRGALFEGRVAWHLTHALAVEGTFSMTRTHLRAAVRNDSEQAAPIVATSPLTQYAAEAGLLWHLNGLTFGHGRARPFITGGGGYLRQLHDGATLVETGQSAYAGGGLKYRLHEGARRSMLKAIGLRADARLNLTHGGFDVDPDAWRKYSSLSGGLFVCF